jgi:hypothetical protein
LLDAARMRLLLSIALLCGTLALCADAAADDPASSAPSAEAPAAVGDASARSWSVRAHVVTGAIAEGINQGVGHYPDAGVAGVGLALRAMLDRHFALQGEGDLLGGFDLAGRPRAEAMGLGSLLLFLNPDDPLQVFVEGSLGLDVSRLSGESFPSDGPTYTYYYAVAGAGLGAEWRLTQRFALVGEARGLLRGRLGGLAADDTLLRDGQGNEATTGAMVATVLGARYEF